MHVIWETTFWCDACRKDAVGQVYNKESAEPLPEEEKTIALVLLKHYHQIETHTSCWRCGRHIMPHQIADVEWIDNTFKDICGDCA